MREKTASDRDFRLLITASVCMGLGACINSAAFNNYLLDRYALNMGQRTFLEFPRELPGFLVSLFIGILASLGDVRIAAFAGFTASAGMLALGWIPPEYGLMLGAVFIYSAGTHIYMPLGNAIGMRFAGPHNRGTVLGKIQAATTGALVAGAGALLLLFRFAHLSYRAAFSAGATCYCAAGLALFAMKSLPRNKRAPRFVVNKKYSRYYVLSFLYGARKQIFITFGPWMLVDLYRQSVSTMTLLFFIVSVLGIFVKPAVGRWTDRFGPKIVLGAESLITIGVCVMYAFAHDIFPSGLALAAVAICYIFDQASDAVSLTRAVYASQSVQSAQELSPTLSLGISIDHLVSMFLPMLGGLIWRSAGNAGYRWVFAGGALVALCNYWVTRGIAAAQPPELPETAMPEAAMPETISGASRARSSSQGTTK